jgi:hypothetical protein
MPAGRPQKVDPGALYSFAHQFYWDLRGISEGHFRWRYDEEKYKQLASAIDSQKVQLDYHQEVALAKAVMREVHEGRLPESEIKPRLRQMKNNNLEVTRDWLHQQAAEMARKQEKIPGKPEVIARLLKARTSEEVRTICSDAFVQKTIQIEPGITRQVMVPNWSISVGSVLPMYLSQYASEFLAAKSDKRFPASDRATSQLKQLWFLSRALAGALFGVTTRTAINLVGSKRPEKVFEESRAGKSLRKQKRQRRKP